MEYLMRKLLSGLLIACIGVFVVSSVLGHEGREVGEYTIEFGWKVEPAYAGLLNGPEVHLALHDAAEGDEFPEDVEVSLEAEVSFGSESMVIGLVPSLEESGHYVGTVIPSLPGDYSFRIFGTIGETEVDETFSAADGQFSTVEPATDILFPSGWAADYAALLARIEELEARLATLEGGS